MIKKVSDIKPNPTCKFCHGTEHRWCPEKSPAGRYCTREFEHEGNHVSCGIEFHELEEWPQE